MDNETDFLEEFVELTEMPTDEEQLTVAVEPGPPTYQSLNPQHQTTQQLPYPQDDNVPQMGQQVVTMQPTPYVETVVVPPRSANRAILWSILVLICCCSPCGCISLVCAIMAKTRFNKGEQEQGNRLVLASNKANVAGVALGILVGIVMGIVVIIAFSQMKNERYK